MTDSELIQLVQEKAPEELSFDEVELWRERLKHSAELGETLLGQLQMEEYVSRALGRVAVSVDEIYSTAAARGAASRQRLLALLGWTASLGLGIVVLLWLVLGNSEKPPHGAVRAPADDGKPRIAALEPKEKRGTTPAVRKNELPADPPAENNAEPATEPNQTTEKPEPPPQVAARDPVPAPVRPAAADATPAPDEWPELSPRAPRRPLADAAFDDIDGPLRGISKNQLSRWFAPVPGQNHGSTEANRGNVVVAGFDGLVRLRAPWPADGVLSLTPFDHHGMAIHFWSGKTGVSLYYYQHPRPTWAAYRNTRKGPEPRPATFSLAATDNDRYDRSAAGTIEIRHQAGAIVLSRGDLRLLAVPFDDPPGEVYFDRHAWLRTFAMNRGESMPDDAHPPGKNVLAHASPSALDWTKQLSKGVSLNKVGERAMQLAADKGTETSWAAVKLPGPGLYEVVFHIG